MPRLMPGESPGRNGFTTRHSKGVDSTGSIVILGEWFPNSLLSNTNIELEIPWFAKAEGQGHRLGQK
ncbi:hypothetical protein CEXT_140331 [Caerostris extrusa]|uniref:Uncharacterized protein n=1 Tax=Caerostris extrusa TaxID=172846 RepID=A0AAV4XMJ5_CAEEX|nr:hypothetical protein CEXT_140331 [Caerostris extrusa]